MNNQYKVSIITISFNAEKSIEQTLKSVINQSYSNVEYIVVDGNSKDKTKEIIEKYKHQISNYISEPDNGLYDALNKGLALATGDLIGILHSDDFYPNPTVLQSIVDMFSNNIDSDAISSSVQIFKNENFKKPFRFYNATKFKHWQLKIGMQPPHPGFFITRNALDKVGYFRPFYKISGDFEWFVRFYLIHHLKVFSTDFVSVYMRDGGLSSSGFKSKKLMNAEDLKALKSNGVYSNIILIYLKYLFKIFQFRI